MVKTAHLRKHGRKTIVPISDNVDDYIGYNSPSTPKKTKKVAKRTIKKCEKHKGKPLDFSNDPKKNLKRADRAPF